MFSPSSKARLTEHDLDRFQGKTLFDRIDRAIAARARLAVLPCCHVFKANDQRALSGWVDGALAIDIMRVVKLEQNGYHVRTQTIPAIVTPKNRLLLATP